MSKMLEYTNINSPIHKLTGASKLIALIIWALASMITYDTRVLILMFILSIFVFKISKVEFKQVSFVLYFILIFLLLNNLAIFIFSPYEGVQIYGSRTDLFKIAGPYTLTLEQLFYQFNITLKYFSIIPMALLFMVATNPSEFAASLNKIGVSYKVAYSVSIALRYIPDVQRDYQDISFAQQARGIDMSKKEKVTKRIKNSAAILMPLIFSSLDRIDTISSAMELRAFGKNKKRTWYSGRKFEKRDYIAISIVSLIFIVAIVATIVNHGRFYNPFI
ncbi:MULTISPECIES: energy-coupling factor transporter transmembrane component T family protein [Clostridium]|jgi:energy-coupling factor transport system permease protein|uniref:energy-coupling factor transporter transmembrane component T family protein n=1 Tax=Clostridium TaxID=1485 RepID=UPI00115739E6|nr:MULTISPECIES: energy-coupling factor transporter transmembrane component T [Clostridium]MBS5306269.1 energy-coupling factor transporter transmembrane protein EcfT [Clostridium sp.]MDB1933415.1 energy-coupling factor transporter transmembrane component T [Clostridium tertium]MDB1937437.1 energy-coupling factor transporter transmembrane component T [Clostridium tertium]MDB1943808.1 energy-coupling factor transporter transmembrane component T [Clostridium tertium]MDB1951026.1 energy-coupling f